MPVLAEVVLVALISLLVGAWLVRPNRPWPKGEFYKGFFSTENRRGE